MSVNAVAVVLAIPSLYVVQNGGVGGINDDAGVIDGDKCD